MILPINDSISVTLDPAHLCTTTTVSVSPSFDQDRMWLNGKMALQDLPEVPSKELITEEIEDKLDLPDVPTKAPVAPKVVADEAQDASAEVSEKKSVMEEPLPA
ncbi:unnamed protein product [Camellia sinensis]